MIAVAGPCQNLKSLKQEYSMKIPTQQTLVHSAKTTFNGQWLSQGSILLFPTKPSGWIQNNHRFARFSSGTQPSLIHTTSRHLRHIWTNLKIKHKEQTHSQVEPMPMLFEMFPNHATGSPTSLHPFIINPLSGVPDKQQQQTLYFSGDGHIQQDYIGNIYLLHQNWNNRERSGGGDGSNSSWKFNNFEICLRFDFKTKEKKTKN